MGSRLAGALSMTDGGAITARPEWSEGVRLYNTGEFYEAHEQWEILWLAEENDELRLFLQGLIQLTSAFHKLFGQRHIGGAGRLLARALTKLDRYPATYLGVALGPLREAAYGCLSGIEELSRLEQRVESFDRSRVPRLIVAE
jgi:predicted metal-dependent hydrolase